MTGRFVGARIASVLLVASACSGTTGPDLDAMAAARTVFADAGSDLGTSARAVVAAARSARLSPATNAEDGQPSAARDLALDQLAMTLDALESAAAADLAFDAAVSADVHVAAALDAWGTATAAAGGLVAEGRRELAFLRDLLEAEHAIADAALLWDEPGSRAEQTVRLAGAAEKADEAAAELAELDEVPSCGHTLARRIAAAELVAERSRELAGHVRSGRGADFDEARAAYRQEPFDELVPSGDAADASCWEAQSPIPTHAAAVEEAIAALVDALNPG